jgi:DNA-binding NarL/FixJ family response regulator
MSVGVAALDTWPREATPEATTVMLVDDQRLVLRGLELFLNRTPEGLVRVVASTGNAADAVDLARRHRPQVAVVDLALAPPGGLSAIRELKRHCPWTRILACSAVGDVPAASAALRAGADGFLLKSSDPDVLAAALRTLAGGLAVIPQPLLAPLIDSVLHQSVPGHLTADDKTLWRLVAEGLETADICQTLYLSERTAKRRVASLLRRLGVTNRVQAAALAGRCGLLDDVDDH